MAEERRRRKIKLETDDNAQQDSQDISMEDATSFSGNSNNVFTTGELLINSGSVPAFRTDQLIYQSPEVEETLVPIFDNTILIDPLLRQQQHQNGQQAVFHEPYKTVVKHNCLNHHPYGTFYYSKKTGKTGRHYPNQPILAKVPNSPILNSHHHTVMAGGITFPDNNGPYVRTAVQTTTTNNFGNYFYRNSPAQSSSTSSRTKRKVWDWSKSWKKYKNQQTTINEEPQTETEEEEEECRCKRCITRAMNNPEKALNSVSQIDKISRIVFPMAFISLNGFYWFTYLKHSQR